MIANPPDNGKGRRPMNDASQGNVLVVDDEPGVRDIVKTYLEYGKMNVTVASDGEEALKLAEKKEFDVVLSDIMMPRMNGFKLVNTLAMDRHDIPMPKVIMLTSLADKENVQRGLSVGADVYIPKPFNLEDVAARVSELLGETPAK